MDKTDPYYSIYINIDGTINEEDPETGTHTRCFLYRPNKSSEPWRWVDHKGYSGYTSKENIPYAVQMAALLLS